MNSGHKNQTILTTPTAHRPPQTNPTEPDIFQPANGYASPQQTPSPDLTPKAQKITHPHLTGIIVISYVFDLY